LANELLKLSDEEFVHRVNNAFVGEENKSELGYRVENMVQDGFDLLRNC
jgi:hypothetical protein